MHYDEFRAAERFGRGTIEYSDGITLSGEFVLPERTNDEIENEGKGELDLPMGSNRYRRGLPHGHVHIYFENGDEYEGEMRNGMITGQGGLRKAIEKYIGYNAFT